MLRLAWLAGAICVGLFLCMMLPAFARDPDGRYASSPNAEWFKSQHNSQGQWCCTEADGHVFYGDYAINKDGSVTVRDGGQKYEIEKYKVLTSPNPTNGAVWWFIDDGAGRTTFCFSPGSLS